MVAAAGIIGLISAGAPRMLHITQPANGTVVIESQINEAHVRIYKPGGETVDAGGAGQGGAVTMNDEMGQAGRWSSEGAMKAPERRHDHRCVKSCRACALRARSLTMGRDDAAGRADGRDVVVEHARSIPEITDVGACETWPTPCKRSP